jgi:putative ABC transport system permease protein
MSLKYVLRALSRRKLRTIIIIIALTIGVAMVGALLALVDTQRQFSAQSMGEQTGGYDISVSKSDLAESTFFDVNEVESVALSAYSKVDSMYPRIQSSIEGRKSGALEGTEVTLVALDTVSDTLVSVEQATTNEQQQSGLGFMGIRIGTSSGGGGGRMGGGGGPGGGGPGGGGGAPPGGGGPGGSSSSSSSNNSDNIGGTYPPEEGQVFLSSDAATALGVKVGEEVLLSYAIPSQREVGKSAITTTSTPRMEGTFIVSGIGTVDGLGSSVSNPIIMNLSDAQRWLGYTGQANKLLMVWTGSNTGTTDAHATVTSARDVGEVIRDKLQAALGSEYEISLPKYTRLEGMAQSYTTSQIYITLYGLLSMGIIGLMINALMTTTVAEQKVDLAVLRVIGSQRSNLYKIVILEVALLGVVGLVIGLILGRLINDYLIVPIMLANLDLPAGVRASWTLSAVLTPTAITVAVLALATVSPARSAADTKVMVILNPAAADQPTLDDMAKLRERRADSGLLISGLVLLAFSAVILIVLPTVFTAGNSNGQTILNFGSLILMVIGASLLFYFVTTPLERLLIKIYQLIAPKAAFFAGRYALRGKGRNALISLMIVMSSVMPCLLATQQSVQDANAATSSHFSNGAPLIAQARSTSFSFPIFSREFRQEANLTADDVSAVTSQPGIGDVVGIADSLSGIQVSDRIGLRTARVSVVGVDGDLSKVLYSNLYRWSEGNVSALTRIVTDTDAVIISLGLSQSLDLHVGDPLLVTGTGTDHTKLMTIVAVASRIPGFSDYFTRNTSDANGSGILVNLETYRDLRNNPANGEVDETEALLTKLMATIQPGVNETTLIKELRNYLGSNNSMSLTATSESVTTARQQLEQSRVFTVLLTGLSMMTAIFGVLAVMYTAVMGRRIEIGMLKAVGASRGALRGAFIGEALITTLAAGFAGIVAGTLIGYAFSVTSYIQEDTPFLLAFDFSTAGIIIAMVAGAAIFSAALATQPVIKQKAITILREK